VQRPRFRRPRKDLRYLLAQATQTLSDVFYLGQPGPFRAAPQCLVGLLLGLRLQGLTEQARLAHQPFPGRPIGLLVMLIPSAQLAGGERFALQGGEQELGWADENQLRVRQVVDPISVPCY